MTIEKLQISYPDFQIGNVIDPEHFDINNGEIVSKINEIADALNVTPVNYVHPESHPASMITQSSSYRFVTDTDKTRWNGYESKINNILSLVYPIGSIYMSVSSVNPQTLFGGTWVAWGEGQVPVGLDVTQTEFNTVEKTGGEKTHRLLTDELPDFTSWSGDTNYGRYNFLASTSFNAGTSYGMNYTHLGKGVAHNNLQPYITCYMWKRTA